MIKPLTDIFRLFFPATCDVCGNPLAEDGEFICNECRWEMPLTGFWNEMDNPVAKRFYGMLPVIHASSFFHFVHDSNFRSLIHRFKYHGGWRTAEKIGIWYGSELKNSGMYEDIDIVIPIPLHRRKLLKRGYNQSAYIAKGIARSLNRATNDKTVYRKTHTRSQTKLDKHERWDNVKNIFSVTDPAKLNGKHILLVDDVLTTGATIISCGESILRNCPDCHISVAILASSQQNN